MIANPRLYYLLLLVLSLAILAWWLPVLLPISQIAVLMVVATATIDLLLAARTARLGVVRDAPHTLPVGVWSAVTLDVSNPTSRLLEVDVFDHCGRKIDARKLPLKLVLPARSTVRGEYDIRPTERGDSEFSCTQLRFHSPLKLWTRQYRVDNPEACRIFPNFAAIQDFNLLALENRLGAMGIVHKRQRGEGQNFHQLRDYQRGDSLRQIDWKASSRLRRAISREYDQEKDQEITVLLDCGYRMSAKDDDLSHFDRALNASLLLAFIALRQGDAVGFGTFGGINRHLLPIKGPAMISQLLDTTYDLDATKYSPDYAEACRALLTRQQKRSLVIFVSNLRDSDVDDLLPALKLLQKRHVVVFCALREEVLDAERAAPINGLDDAIRTAATHTFINQRQKALSVVQSNGIHCVDCAPRQLAPALINAYFEIKASGQL